MDIQRSGRTVLSRINNSTFSNIIRHPIQVSILLTVIVYILIASSNKSCRLFSHLLIINVCVIFIHNNMIIQKHNDDINKNISSAIVDTIDKTVDNLIVGSGLEYIDSL